MYFRGACTSPRGTVLRGHLEAGQVATRGIPGRVDDVADLREASGRRESCSRLQRCNFRIVQRSVFFRSRRELSNAYLLAKCGFDTAENEPCQVCPIEQCSSQLCPCGSQAMRTHIEKLQALSAHGPTHLPRSAPRSLVERFDIEPFPDFSAK